MFEEKTLTELYMMREAYRKKIDQIEDKIEQINLQIDKRTDANERKEVV